MSRRPGPREQLLHSLQVGPARFAHLTGIPYWAERESSAHPDQVDHVWITLECPPLGRFIAAVNTSSRLNLLAGFNPQVRVGTLGSTWSEKPHADLRESEGFDYEAIEAGHPIDFELFERETLADLLIEKSRAAIRVEVWGDLFARRSVGIHQIHSRRASSAMPHDVRHRDGALKFYYERDHAAELLLFKFHGQV